MRQCFRQIHSECYKFLHSPLVYIHVIVPLVSMAVFLLYYMISPWEETQKVSVYLQLLAVAFPVLIGVITAMASENESQAGSFQFILSAPSHKFLPHFAKLLVLLITAAVSSIIAVCGFGMVFRLMGNSGFSMDLYAKAALLLFLGSIPLYLFQYLLAFAFGKGAGLGCGIVGSLLAALLITGLGDNIWMFLPWGLSIRFVSILTAYSETTLLEAPEMKAAGCFLVTGTILFLMLLLLWSKKWEGRKGEED